MMRMLDNFPGSWRWLTAAVMVTVGADLPLPVDSPCRLAQACAQTAAASDSRVSQGGSGDVGGQGVGQLRRPPVARVSTPSVVRGSGAIAARAVAAPGKGAVERLEQVAADNGYLPAALRSTTRRASHDELWLDGEHHQSIPLAPTMLSGGRTGGERLLPAESPVVAWQDGIEVGPIPAGWTLKSVDTLKLGNFPERTHPQDAAEGILAGAPKGPLFEQVQIGRVATWIAPNITYQPLLFEDARLERYGFASPHFGIQPIRSGFHFTNSALLFPIRAVVYRNECESPLAFERPGNQVAPSREIFVPAIGR